MVAPNRPQDTTETIRSALAAHLPHLTEEQMAAVKQFVEQAGGIEQARQTIDSLEKVNRAA